MKLMGKQRWFLIPLLLLLALLLFHSQYTFCQSDETPYVATPKRIYQGDRLFIDEWQPTQCYAPLVVPFYALYRLVVPSGDGVLLFFRILYILFAGTNALCLFSVFRKRCGVWPTLCAATLCLLYSRANIAGVSYYNLSLQFSISSLLCVTASMDASKQSKARIYQVAAGVLIAFAVLCSPYLAVFVLLGLVALLIFKRTRSLALYIGMGVIGSAALYLIFFIDLSDIQGLIDNVPFIFSDPDHLDPLSLKITIHWREIREYLAKPMLLIELAFCIYIAIAHIIKKRIPLAVWIVYVACLIGFIYPVMRTAPDAVCYVFFFPFSIYMLPFVWQHLLSKKSVMPVVMYVFGFCIAFTFFLASNTGIDAMTIGYCLSSIASILTVSTLFHATTQTTKVFTRVLACALGVLFLALVVLSGAHRFIGIYRDAPLPQLTVRLESGPAKGLLTSENNAKQYNSIYAVIHELSTADPDATVFHSAKTAWAYLCSDWQYGAPTTWPTKISSERLPLYYNLHPNKIPDYVFVYEPNVGEYQSVMFNNHKPALPPNQNDLSGEFYEYMQANGSIILSTEYVTVYKLNNN